MDDKQNGDTVDARIAFNILKPKNVEVVPVESYDSEEYFMKLPKMGKCFIFNHKKFDAHTELKERECTDADVTRLYCRFTALGFNPEVFNDFTVRKVNDKLQEVAKENYSDCCCFVCCILTHGSNGFLYASDGCYPLSNIFTPFQGNSCPSLVGKPKLFFIQACQGQKTDPGVRVVCKTSDVSKCKESFDSISRFKIPTQADFLVAYSTAPGFFAWANPTCGSYFIQALCDALEKYAKEKDLLKILTIVNRRVAFEFESNCPKKKKRHLKKQVPYITSTLTRDVKFY